MNEIFFNKFERLRSGWRFVIFSLLFAIISSILGLVLLIVLRILTHDDKDAFLSTLSGMLLTALISLIVASIVGWFCGKYLEDLPIKTLGWAFHKSWIKHFAFGLVIGVFSIIFAAVLAIPSGSLSFSLNQAVDFSTIFKSITISSAILLVAAASEEVLFRGYILQTLIRAKLAWLGILLTSLPFALAHIGNPSAASFSTINTIFAGFWLSLAYLKTRSLWFALGIHFAWNLVQGSFLGSPISGLTNLTRHSLLQYNNQGPNWLTGGSYGIEGGLICTVSLAVSMLIVWFLPFIKADEELLLLTSNEIQKGKSILTSPAPTIFESI
jgi:uncharacterized protein